MIPLPGRVFQEAPGFGDHLRYELGVWDEVWGSLYYAGERGGGGNPAIPGNAAPDGRKPVFWACNIWL
ncbi:MAG: hypothetical protein LBH15_03690, partial [Treponema sp.]|nr:hypothetical protein [Treponema sp.]